MSMKVPRTDFSLLLISLFALIGSFLGGIQIMSYAAFVPFILIAVALDGGEWVGATIFLVVPLVIWAILGCWWVLAGVKSAEASTAAKAAFVALLVGSVLWYTYSIVVHPVLDIVSILLVVGLAMLPPIAIITIYRYVQFSDPLSKKLFLHCAALCWVIFSAFPIITDP